MSTLFIGGPFDGHKMDVPKGAHTVALRAPGEVGRINYRLVRLSDSSEAVHEVFVAPGVDPVDHLLKCHGAARG